MTVPGTGHSEEILASLLTLSDVMGTGITPPCAPG